MRVLHVLTNSLPHTQSGYTVRSHAILKAQNRAGIVAVAATRLGYPESIGVSPAGPVYELDGVTYVRMPDGALPSLPDARLEAATSHLLALVDVFRPDILHTTTNYENGLVVRAVSRITGIPWVYETRGEMEKTWLARHTGKNYALARKSEYYRMVREAETRLIRDADAVITLSRVQKLSHIRRGADEASIRVVPNAVDPAYLSLPLVDAADARRRCGLEEAFTIGTVSSLVEYEGLDTMLQAVALLRAEGHYIRAVIVGDGAARPGLMSLANVLGVQDAVDFPGRVAIDGVCDWYDAIDIFCVPRRDVDVTRSVTPLKPLQAMARQRPVIVSDLDALTEITSDLGAGLAVRPEDPGALAEAVRLLATDRAMYETCASEARRAAEGTRWDIAASTYLAMYMRVTGGGR